MPALWTLTNDILALDSLIEEQGGELGSVEVEAAWLAMASELADNESAKLDSYVNWIRNLEKEAALAKAEADQYAMEGERYAVKARVRENRVKWIESKLKEHLIATKRTKVSTATNRVISVQANGGIQKVLLADNLEPGDIPDSFAIVRRSPDNDAIRKHLASGGELPFATLGERGTHLRIK